MLVPLVEGTGVGAGDGVVGVGVVGLVVVVDELVVVGVGGVVVVVEAEVVGVVGLVVVALVGFAVGAVVVEFGGKVVVTGVGPGRGWGGSGVTSSTSVFCSTGGTSLTSVFCSTVFSKELVIPI